MPNTKEQVVIVIIAVILILLFLGILFLVMTLYYANKRKQLQNEKEALLEEFNRQSLQSKLEIQEQTFSFISGEIHDNVGQVLSLAKVQLSILEQSKELNFDLLRETKESVGKALTELRDMAKSLSREHILAFDLLNSVEEEVCRINKTGIVRVSLAKEGFLGSIKSEEKLLLFRVIQESLQNVVKHANATLIEIRMLGSETGLHILLKDDGIGFDVKEVLSSNGGLGLKNMQKRIELIGGSFAIESLPGQGTQVNIKVNYV